jgi:hypothetical protein
MTWGFNRQLSCMTKVLKKNSRLRFPQLLPFSLWFIISCDQSRRLQKCLASTSLELFGLSSLLEVIKHAQFSSMKG